MTPLILFENHTAGGPGVVMRHFGLERPTGMWDGWDPGAASECEGLDDAATVAALVVRFCGTDNAFCNRMAAELLCLPPQERWVFFGGGFGTVRTVDLANERWVRLVRTAQVEAWGIHMRIIHARGATIAGGISDHEETTRKTRPEVAADLEDMVYTHADRGTFALGVWEVWDGHGAENTVFMGEDNRPLVRTRGGCDGKRVVVKGYLRADTGVALDEQRRRIVAACDAALKAGYEVIVLITGALAAQTGVPYTEFPGGGFAEAWRLLVAELRERPIRAWWIHNKHAQFNPPFGTTWLWPCQQAHAEATARHGEIGDVGKAMLAMVNRMWTACGTPAPGDWPEVRREAVETVCAIRGW